MTFVYAMAQVTRGPMPDAIMKSKVTSWLKLIYKNKRARGYEITIRLIVYAIGPVTSWQRPHKIKIWKSHELTESNDNKRELKTKNPRFWHGFYVIFFLPTCRENQNRWKGKTCSSNVLENMCGWPSGPVGVGMLASLAGCVRVPHTWGSVNLAFEDCVLNLQIIIILAV